MTYQQMILIIYFCVILIMSFVSLFLFKKDKSLAASKTAVRIKEKTLLESVVLGGAIGGFIGRILFHHKTNKIYFSIAIYLSLVLEIGIAILLVVLVF